MKMQGTVRGVAIEVLSVDHKCFQPLAIVRNIKTREWEVTPFVDVECSHANITTQGGITLDAGDLVDTLQDVCADCGEVINAHTLERDEIPF